MKSWQIKTRTEFLPRKWPCFAIGFIGGGREFVVHLWLVSFTISWGL